MTRISMLGEDDEAMLQLSDTENEMDYDSGHVNFIESSTHRYLPTRDGTFSQMEDGVRSSSPRQSEYTYEAKFFAPK